MDLQEIQEQVGPVIISSRQGRELMKELNKDDNEEAQVAKVRTHVCYLNELTTCRPKL